jgi:hypothetical protein
MAPIFADGFGLSICNNSKCAGIHLELFKDGELFAFTIVAPDQARDMSKAIQDLLYEKATEQVK